MSYTLKGEICGRLCPECDEPLIGIVRLYRPESYAVAGETAGGTATLTSVKQTLAILSPEQVEAKHQLLVGEAELDADGGFAVQLEKGYDGGPLELDVYCETVPHLKGRPRSKPKQFAVTMLTPEWSEGRQQVASFETCLPSAFWSVFRKEFGGWTICGHYRAVGTHLPVPNVHVTAIDVDWIQDDPLGTAVSDSSGHFRIDYSVTDFERTPLGIPWELTQPGPDVYFKAMLNSATVLDEPSSRGRAPDREDVGAVFCVELDLDVSVGPPVKDAHFTHVGDFDVDFDIDALTGLTNKAVLGHGGPHYGFWGSVLFRGYCPKQNPGGAHENMRYRFLYDDGSGPTPIAGAMIAPISAGSRPVQWNFGGGLVWVWQPIVIQGTGTSSPQDPTPSPLPVGTWGPVPVHVIVADPDGWVEVDQWAIDDGFFDLLGLSTAAVAPGGGSPVGAAGSAVATPENGKSLAIVFEAATVGSSPAAVVFTNQLDALHVNNWVEAHALWISQLGAGCNGITSAIDIEHTVDHELLDSFSVAIGGAAWPQPLSTALPTGTGPRGGFGTTHEDTSGWAKCSYTVSLGARLRLTDGRYDDSGRSYPVTFCKS